jgi:hypothetical protein
MALPYYAGFMGGTADTDGTEGDFTFLEASWTQEVSTVRPGGSRFLPDGQKIYAKASLHYYAFDGDFEVAKCGIVEYTKGATFGPPDPIPAGENFAGGLAPFILDSDVNSVTFGGSVQYALNGYAFVSFNLEIWA